MPVRDPGTKRFRILLIVLVLGLSSLQCRRSPRPPAPNFLIFVVDALRVDHLGVYGYSRGTSPRLDEYARQGVVFDRAYAQAPSTFPSTAAILTGRYPSETQIINERSFELSRDCITLAEVLKDEGYKTGFFTANPLHAYDSLGTGKKWSPGFEQGFDEFFVGSQFYSKRLRAAALSRHAMKWLGQAEQGKPWLACIWYIDVHTPYDPPSQFRELFPDPYKGRTISNKEIRKLWKTGNPIPDEARQHFINLYDGEIAYTDSSMGDMLDSLAQKGILENTAVMVTADHGEAFYEHGQWIHGFGLYEELIHIPMIILPPHSQARSQPSRNASLVGLIDLMPTILDYAGVPKEKRPEEMQGLSLRQLVEGTNMEIRRGAIAAELALPLKPEGDPTAFSSRALITERFKLIEEWGQDQSPKIQLFDLEQDPFEQHSLAEDPASSEQVELLRAQLKFVLGEEEKLAVPALPKRIRERLRAIGYL